jgi:hypothetical protein
LLIVAVLTAAGAVAHLSQRDMPLQSQAISPVPRRIGAKHCAVQSPLVKIHRHVTAGAPRKVSRLLGA